MKEIKKILYTLYIIFYTSLIWSVPVFWETAKVGPNQIRILFWIAFIFTFVNIATIIGYLVENWDKE